eukprot:871172-Pyramimonas_sp.AAC.1
MRLHPLDPLKPDQARQRGLVQPTAGGHSGRPHPGPCNAGRATHVHVDLRVRALAEVRLQEALGTVLVTEGLLLELGFRQDAIHIPDHVPGELVALVVPLEE